MSRAQLLQLLPLPAALQARLEERYTVHRDWPAPALLPEIHAVLTNGSIGLSAEHMARLPGLRLIHAFGAALRSATPRA